MQIKQIKQNSQENHIELHILFVDYKQAFDQLHRGKIIQDLENVKTPKKIIRLIKMSMKDSRAVINREKGDTRHKSRKRSKTKADRKHR